MTHRHSSLSLGFFSLMVAGHALSCTSSSARDLAPVAGPPDVFEQARGFLGQDTERAAAALCGASTLVAPGESVGPLVVHRCLALEVPWRVELISQGKRVELIALSQDRGDTQPVTLPEFSTGCVEPETRLDDSIVWRRCSPPVFVAATGRLLLARPGQRLFVAMATSDEVLALFYSSIGLSLR